MIGGIVALLIAVGVLILMSWLSTINPHVAGFLWIFIVIVVVLAAYILLRIIIELLNKRKKK